mgnify:FL=1
MLYNAHAACQVDLFAILHESSQIGLSVLAIIRGRSPLRLALLATSIFSISVAAWVALVGEDQRGEAILACDEPVQHIGTTRQGERVTAKFLIKNRGSDEAVILETPAACGCTVAKISGGRILAGASTELTAEWNVGVSRGERTSKLSIVYASAAESGNRELQLAMKADVIPDYDISQESLIFSRDKDSPNRLSVTLTPRLLQEIQILDASCTNASFKAVITEHSPNAAKVEVLFTPDLLRRGERDSLLQIKTNSTRQPLVQVRLLVDG